MHSKYLETQLNMKKGGKKTKTGTVKQKMTHMDKIYKIKQQTIQLKSTKVLKVIHPHY